jgi:AcrR family transcriptional regulator
MQEPLVETKRDKELKSRRAHILEAALMSLLEKGYHQTGVRDIAKRAGVSLGNLYNHFSGKHAVLGRCCMDRLTSDTKGFCFIQDSVIAAQV